MLTYFISAQTLYEWPVSKYDPLRQHLSAMSDDRWRVRFPEIEGILGFSLPRSAYAYPAWWSNDATGHSHSLAWLDAGWKTEQVDLQNQQVTFRKDMNGGARKQESRKARTLPDGTLHGAISGVIQMVSGTDLTKLTGGAGTLRKG